MVIKKHCTKCNIEYPATRKYFSPDKRHDDGLYSCCKKCACAATKTWQKDNKEKIKERCKKDYKTLRGYITYLIRNIKARCNNPNNPKYNYYGGRGIQCLFTPDELFSWVVANNVEPRGRHIHRINNDGNYDLNNIEFMDGGIHISLHRNMQEKR